MSIPSRHYKRHCIKICTCWNETTNSNLNRPPGVNITLIISNLVLFFPLNAIEYARFHEVFRRKEQQSKLVINFMHVAWVQYCRKHVFKSKHNFKPIFPCEIMQYITVVQLEGCCEINSNLFIKLITRMKLLNATCLIYIFWNHISVFSNNRFLVLTGFFMLKKHCVHFLKAVDNCYVKEEGLIRSLQ